MSTLTLHRSHSHSFFFFSSARMPPRCSDGLWGGYTENGRLYHKFRQGTYLLPCDEDEQDRLDIYHKFFFLVRNRVLHTVPFSAPIHPGMGPMILDWGTGTGIWAIEMADRYLPVHGKVYGVDLAWTQPPNIPPNLTFLQGDIELPWHSMGANRWDLIHIRMLNGGVSDWRSVYRNAYSHLKPGHGWLEHTEIDITPRCDDGSVPDNSALHYWTRLLSEAADEAGRSIEYNSGTGSVLAQCGFENIREQVFQAPLNPWPASAHAKEIGRWYNLGLLQGLQALTLAPLTRFKGWSVEEVNKLCNDVRREICCKEFHVYHNVHVWNARRPSLPS